MLLSHLNKSIYNLKKQLDVVFAAMVATSAVVVINSSGGGVGNSNSSDSNTVVCDSTTAISNIDRKINLILHLLIVTNRQR